jgi:AcrR family transcriptional regulator
MIASAAETQRRPGRPLDLSGDDVIRRATQEILGDHGDDLLTADGVAARAHASKATIYRRRPSKADLAIDADRCLAPWPDFSDRGSLEPDLPSLPVTKVLRDDSRSRVMTGPLSAMRRNADLAQVFQQRLVAPPARALRTMLERTVARGEVAPDHDLDLLSSVLPAMLFYRTVIAGYPLDSAHTRAVVEQVLPLATAPAVPAKESSPAIPPYPLFR